MTRRMANK